MATPRRQDPFLKRLGMAFVAASEALSREPRPAGRRRSYNAGEMGATTGDWRPRLAHPDAEVKRNFRRHRARSRDLFKNDGYFRKYGKMLLVNVVGPTGLTLKAQNMDASGKPNVVVNKAIEAHWKRFLKTRFTVDGKYTFLQASKLALKTVAADGECLVRVFRAWERNPYGIGMQFLDADQLDERLIRAAGKGQNEIRMGIEIDQYGAPVRFWFRQPAAFDAPVESGELFSVPAGDILHLYDPDRVNQTRGVPWGTSVMIQAANLEAYVIAEIHAARMHASTIATIEEPADEMGPSTDDEDEGPPPDIQFVPGGVFEMTGGRKLNPFTPSHPNVAFPDFVKQNVRQQAVGFNVWSNELASDAEGISYATGRLFKLAAEDDWSELQQWFIAEWQQPWFELWLESALLVPGLLNFGTFDLAQLTEAEWQTRVWAWLDPMKEVQAKAIELDRRLTSPQRILAEQNLDPETVLNEWAEWEKMGEEKGVNVSSPALTNPIDPADPASDTGSASGLKALIRALGWRS